ncbi:MAG: glycosyltransferase [Nitriliruptor sp.]
MSAREPSAVVTAPDISVVVPVLDDPEGIDRTVASLHLQTLPTSRFEVLVVDNGSRDRTRAAAVAIAAAGPATVEVLVEDRVRTSYGARNAGIDAARGWLVCFLDADETVPPDHLERVLSAVEREGLDYAGCPVEIVVDRPTVAACHNRLFGFPVADYLASGWVPTCCLTVRRSVIDRIGPFDAALTSGGDAEFGRRAAEAGVRQGLIVTTAVSHPARGSVAALTRKTRRTARGKRQLAARDPRHRHVVRGYASWERLRPLAPWWVRAQLAAAGLPSGWRHTLGVVALKSWLDVVRLGTVVTDAVGERVGPRRRGLVD